jgi:hypothetical protein
MKFPVANYVVMMHHQKAGTFAPAFPTLDEAEEFSNAMRAVTDGIAISEPVPVVITTSGKEDHPLRPGVDFAFHAV